MWKHFCQEFPLQPSLEIAGEIAARTGGSARGLRNQLKALSRRGLIEAGRKDGGLGFKLMPFVVGIYEMQAANMDAELARLFEDYFQQFSEVLRVKPQVHRIIPVGETVHDSIEVRPFESAAEIVNATQSWGALDRICRKQKALIFTRKEWLRGPQGISEEDGVHHFAPMNCIGWTVGHLAWHEQRTFCSVCISCVPAHAHYQPIDGCRWADECHSQPPFHPYAVSSLS